MERESDRCQLHRHGCRLSLSRIDGQSANQDVTVSQQPLIKWKAPVLGAPKLYEVRFYRVFMNAAGETIRSFEFEATFMTPHTQIQIPPGVLLAGKTYYMRVIANVFSNSDFVTRPFSEQKMPRGEARFASALITVH